MTEVHPYERACRNTQHSGCTCMHPVGGKWCGLPRNDPVHADQPTEAPSAAAERIAEIKQRVDDVIHRRQNAHRTQAQALWVVQDDAPFLLDEIDALTTSRDAFRYLSGRHLDRLRALEEIDKEHADCPSHIAVLSEQRDKLTAERDDARAALLAAVEREAGLTKLLLDIVDCTTTRSGEQRRMIQDGKGRQFSATVRKIVALLAAPDRPDLKGTGDE